MLFFIEFDCLKGSIGQIMGCLLPSKALKPRLSIQLTENQQIFYSDYKGS